MSDNAAAFDLTPEEMSLITLHLDFYRSLETEQRAPTTEAQRPFVAVCQCQAKADSVHEVVYLKYKMLAARQRLEVQSEQQGIDEFAEGAPSPGWFTDEDWKRMRRQYLSNSD